MEQAGETWQRRRDAGGASGAGVPATAIRLRWESNEVPGQSVLRLGGVLDRGGLALVRDAMRERLADEPTGIVVDLSGCLVTDRPSLLVFGATARQAAAWPGCPFALFGVQAAEQRAMRRMALDRYLFICADYRQAQRLAVAPDGPLRLSETLAAQPASVPAARALAWDACVRWHLPGLSGDAQLVTAELVGNGVRHAGTPLDLMLHAESGYLHVCVRDRSTRPPRWQASARRGDSVVDVGGGGRGLLLVHSFADVSGHTFTRDGKVVWATLRQR